MSRRLAQSLFNIIIAILIVPVAWVSYVEISKLLGIREIPVEVAGTGSMYPSLYWDETQGGPEKVSESGVEEYRSSPRMYRYYPGLVIGSRTLFKGTLNRGDMVAFSSEKTREILINEGKNPNLGFIKRIVGVSGDTIELRDGFVLRNGQTIDEPYIRSPRSTYGGKSLAECREIIVPPDSYFVLGDNRKVSSDSRFDLGFVKENDIQFYLPLAKQQIYASLWRDTSLDQSLSGTSTLQSEEVYRLIGSLKKNSQLEKSARLRGQALLSNPETNTDLSASLRAAGYSNIITGEFVIYGHFTATELWENLQANYETKSQLSNPDYSELGIAAVNGVVDGCPTQIIVGHLGGYIPATYKTEVVESWVSAKNNIDQVIPSWEQAIGQTGINQDKLQKLLSLLRERRSLIVEVLTVMEEKAWISNDLQARIDRDDDVSRQIEELAKQLNQGE